MSVLPLTRRQLEVLRAIVRYRRETGEAPGVRFLARRLKLHHSTIQEHLAALASKGWLRTPTPAGTHCTHVP